MAVFGHAVGQVALRQGSKTAADRANGDVGFVGAGLLLARTLRVAGEQRLEPVERAGKLAQFVGAGQAPALGLPRAAR